MPDDGSAYELPNSATHARLLRALPHYTSPAERELAIDNLRWMSSNAPSHTLQMDCRMLLLALRNVQSFGPAP